MTERLSPTRRYALIALAFVVLEGMLMAFVDRPLSEYLRTVDAQYKPLIDFFRTWTDLGLSCWYLWPSGVAAILCFALSNWRQVPATRREKLRRAAWMLGFFFVCVAASGIITDAIKPLVGRARPVILDREGFYGIRPFDRHFVYNSFPSGHTTTAFALAFALAALFPRWRKVLIAFAVAIGLSRIMVNAHYLSDVLAGSVVGILTVFGVREMFRRGEQETKKQGIFPIDSRRPPR